MTTLEEMQAEWGRADAEALREAQVRAYEMLCRYGFTDADGWRVEPAGQDGKRPLVRVMHPRLSPVVLKFLGYEAAPLAPFVIAEPGERAGQWVGCARDVVSAMQPRAAQRWPWPWSRSTAQP